MVLMTEIHSLYPAVTHERLQTVVSERSDLPFYEELYAEGDTAISSFEEFYQLPLLDKDEVLGDVDHTAIFLDDAADQAVTSIATSGTSGHPTITMRSERDLETFQQRHRDIEPFYFPEGSRTLVLISPQWAGEQLRALQSVGKFATMGDPKDLAFSAGLVQALDINTVNTTPSAAVRLGRLLERDGWDMTRMDQLVLGGENLSDAARQRLEELFPEADIGKTFGSTEISRAGFQCDELADTDMYHVFPEHHYHEIIDSTTGEPLEVGETGELVTTILWSDTAMPYTRYRTGDRARIHEAPCDCGSSEMVVELLGRIEFDVIKLRGIKVYRTEFEDALEQAYDSGPPRYRIHIHERQQAGTAVPWLRVELEDQSDPRDEQALADEIMTAFTVTSENTWADAASEGLFGPIEVEIVEEIGADGLKTRSVVDHRSD